MKHINELVMNAAYFLNKLRRKQAIINLKNEISKAIEDRDANSNEMIAQIQESQEIIDQLVKNLNEKNI